MTFTLTRDDVRTDLHPNLWEDLCDALGHEPKGTYATDEDYRAAYPDELEVKAK